jgi:hypothetical protein
MIDVFDDFGRVDLEDLPNEIDRTGGRSVFWGIAAADAKTRANGLEHDAKVLRAAVALRIRKEARDLGNKMTEGEVAERVTTDPDVMAADRAALEAEGTAARIQPVIYSTVQKNRTLQELAGIVRDDRNALRPYRSPQDMNPVIPRAEPAPRSASRLPKKKGPKKRR